MAINLALTLTLDGRDAFWNSGNTGTKLDITHLQFGTRNRLPTGEESLLSLPKQSVKIQNGNKIGPDQVRIMATMPGIENYNVTEIGLWSGEPGLVGSILVAYTSVRTGYIAQMVNGIDLVFTYDMVIATTDIDKINIVKDTDQSSTFSLLAEHETDRNAHPFYVTTDTAQTISGAKTFTNKAIFSGGLTGELTGNAATATQLETPRTIGGVSFNGTANINLPGVNIAGNQNTSGNAATASKLAAAVLVGGIAFDGSAAINLPGVNIEGNQNTSGNAATASKLAAARTISLTGDATGSLSFDGSANASAAVTLANTGIAAGTYKSVTIDAKGRATAGNDVVTGLVTAATAAGTANVATSNTNTFLNITEKVGAATASAGTSTQITGAGTVTVGSDAAGKITITGAQSITGNAATATKLQTPRAINGVNFDGSANINLPTFKRTASSNAPFDLNDRNFDGVHTEYVWKNGPAGHGIGGVIGVNYSPDWASQLFFGMSGAAPSLYLRSLNAGITWSAWKTLAFTDSSITGNASTATRLATARTINGVSFDGSANITVEDSTKLPTAGGTITGTIDMNVENASFRFGRNFDIGFVKQNGSSGKMIVGNVNNFEIVKSTDASIPSTISPIANQTFATLLSLTPTGVLTTSGGFNGNASTATKLATARTIGGVSFDGTANINLPGVNTTGNQSTTGNAATATKLATARSINGVGFDGTANITIADNTKLPLTGGTLTGGLTAPNLTATGSINATTCGVTGMGNYSPTGQGAYLSWNRNNGGGRTDFINNRGEGAGGFDWWNGNESSYTQVMSLDQSGVLSTKGGFNGNAASATKLQTLYTTFGSDEAFILEYTSKNGSSFFFDNGYGKTIGQYSSGFFASEKEGAFFALGAEPINGRIKAITGVVRGDNTIDFKKTHTVLTQESTGLSHGLTTGFNISDIAAMSPLQVANFLAGKSNDGGYCHYLASNGSTSGGSFPDAYGAMEGFSSRDNYYSYSWQRFSAVNGGHQYIRFALNTNTWSEWSTIALTSSNVATATKLQTARTINGVAFDGSSNITIADNTKLPLTGGTLTGSLNVSDTITVTNVGEQVGAFKKLIQGHTTTDGGYIAVGNNAADKGYVEIGTIDDADAEIYASQRTSANAVIRIAKLLDGAGNTSFPGTVTAPTFNGALNGNAATATKLQTARTINGVAFDGTANITVYDATKLPTAGGTITGGLTVNGSLGVTSFHSTSAYSFLNGGNAQNIHTGGVLASNAYADASKVPTNGIYAKGNVLTSGNFLTDSKSLATNGYTPLTNGVILQWGTNRVEGDSDLTVTFPVAFPNGFLSAQASLGMNNWSVRGDAGCGAHSPTNTTLVIRNGAGPAGDLFWLAIGY